jgi:hypothetical protein
MHELKAHSIYLTGHQPSALPDKIAANLASFKKCYADFEHQLYKDDSLREFIQKNHPPEVLWAYDQLIPLAYKADLGRYCLLYRLGGIYADLSISFFQRVWLDEFPGKKIFLFRDGFSHAPWIVSNSILMARPGQFIFKYLIDKIVEHVKTHFYGFNPLCPTGPNLMGRAAAQLLEMDEFATGEVVRINKNLNTWSYSYLIPNGEVLAVNVKSGNGLASLGATVSNNYNDYWNSKNIYKTESVVDLPSTNNKFFDNFRDEILTLKKESIDSVTKTKQAEAKAQQAEAKAQQAEAKVQQAEAKVQEAEAKAQQAESKVQQAEAKAQQAEFKAQQAESIGRHYAVTLNAVYASKSWRLTAPLRWVFGQVRRLKHEGLKSRVKAFVKKALRKINHELLLRPSLRQKLIGVSRRLGIHAALKTLLRKAQGYPASLTYSPFVNDGGLSQANLENLSSRARQIYADLKKVVEEKNKQGNC